MGDQNKIGKFKAYINDLWFIEDDNDLKRDLHGNTKNCRLTDFDDEFPSKLQDNEEKKKQIHEILKCFYKIATSKQLKLSDVSIINQSISWNHILEIVDLEFDEKYKETLLQIIGQNALKQIPKNEG